MTHTPYLVDGEPQFDEDGDPIYEDANGWYHLYANGSKLYWGVKEGSEAEAQFYRAQANVHSITRRPAAPPSPQR